MRVSPRISVVIPAYNAAATLPETLRSVLDQTYSDLEVLVIDDGSTDGTREAADACRDPRVRVHTFANAGQAVSRNRGIALARGEFVAFLDSDDLWTPDKLADQLAALGAHPKAAVAYSLTDHIDMRGRWLGPCCHHVVNGDAFDEFLKSNFLASGSNPLVRKSALDEVGCFDPALTPAEDWDLYLRLAVRHPYVCVPKPQILYRLNPLSASASVRKMERAILGVLEKGKTHGRRVDPAIVERGMPGIYRYLTLRSLLCPPSRDNLATAFHCLVRWIRSEHRALGGARPPLRPQLLKLYLLFKLLLLVTLPRSLARAVLIRIERCLTLLSPESPLSYPYAKGVVA